MSNNDTFDASNGIYTSTLLYSTQHK